MTVVILQARSRWLMEAGHVDNFMSNEISLVSRAVLQISGPFLGNAADTGVAYLHVQ